MDYKIKEINDVSDDEEIVLEEDKLDDYVEDNDVNCPNCGSYAVEVLSAEWDMRTVHIPYICRTCGYEYAHVFRYDRHLVENKNLKRYL